MSETAMPFPIGARVRLRACRDLNLLSRHSPDSLVPAEFAEQYARVSVDSVPTSLW